MASFLRGLEQLRIISKLRFGHVNIQALSETANLFPTVLMGKRDKRTWRGKIFRGSYGKARPNPKKYKPFGLKPRYTGHVFIPEPPPHLATPEQFDDRNQYPGPPIYKPVKNPYKCVGLA